MHQKANPDSILMPSGGSATCLRVVGFEVGLLGHVVKKWVPKKSIFQKTFFLKGCELVP